jgi:hypothetical protein
MGSQIIAPGRQDPGLTQILNPTLEGSKSSATPPGSSLINQKPVVSLRSKTTPLDTSRKNQEQTREVTSDDRFVEVTDPTHPLFRREFELLSVSHGSRATAHVTVRYRGDNSLRFPLLSTSLSGLGENAIRSKLTGEAARDLLALVKEYESCQRRPRKSGGASRSRCGKKSSNNSTKSFRR